MARSYNYSIITSSFILEGEQRLTTPAVDEYLPKVGSGWAIRDPIPDVYSILPDKTYEHKALWIDRKVGFIGEFFSVSTAIAFKFSSTVNNLPQPR